MKAVGSGSGRDRLLESRWWPAAIFVAAVAVAALVAEAVGVAASDTVEVVLESAAGAALASALAVALLIVLRRTSVAVQAGVAASAPLAAMAIGVSWATSNMFITGHDLRILWVVLVAAGGAGLASSLILAQRVSGATRAVVDMARRLGEAGPVAVAEENTARLAQGSGSATRTSAPGELARVGAELRQTSTRLAEAQKAAEAIESNRRELVAWVSHDLRTPLAGIRAMVEAIEDGVVSDEETVARYHATIRLETDRLAGLVDDLFELSRIQSGALSLALVPVALDEVLADAVDGARVAARARGLDLSCEIREPVPVVEVGTPEMIRLVRNLLDNAIRHTPAGGRILLQAGLDPEGNGVEIAVGDGCGGIAAEEIPRVFELGYRGDAARTPGEGRGGLGLAVALGLAHAHNGSITVDNAAGGCRFTVRLPIRRPISPPETAA